MVLSLRQYVAGTRRFEPTQYRLLQGCKSCLQPSDSPVVLCGPRLRFKLCVEK